MDPRLPILHNTEWGIFFLKLIENDTCRGCALQAGRPRPCSCGEKGFQCTWYDSDIGEFDDVHFQVKILKEKT